jgi:DNA-directed RNA polymerase specialized sigma24 family protein
MDAKLEKGLVEAIDALPRSWRFALVMRFMEHRTVDEIADRLRIPRSGVYDMLGHALAFVLDKVEDVMPADPAAPRSLDVRAPSSER